MLFCKICKIFTEHFRWLLLIFLPGTNFLIASIQIKKLTPPFMKNCNEKFKLKWLFSCYFKKRYLDFWFYRSSSSQLFFLTGVLQNFAIFTGKHLCWQPHPQSNFKKDSPGTAWFRGTFLHKVSPSIIKNISQIKIQL